MDIIQGILAIIFVLIILLMKESKRKVIGFIGVGVILIGRLYNGNEGFNENWILLVVGIAIIGLVILELFLRYRNAKRKRRDLAISDKIMKKHTTEEFHEIAEWEQNLRFKLAEQKVLVDKEVITDEEFGIGLNLLLKQHREIQKRYNVTEREMQEYLEYYHYFYGNN